MYHISSINENITLGLLHLPDYAAITGLSAKREIEKGATLLLLEKLFESEPVYIHYTAEGKPYLKDKTCHISISHSHDKLAIIVNTKQATGIDIELIREKVLKIKHKFLSASELNDAGENIEKLITYWACKEALYKYYSLKEVDFIDKIQIQPFNYQNTGTAIGQIKIEDFRKKLKLHYEKTEEYMLVYILDEIE